MAIDWDRVSLNTQADDAIRTLQQDAVKLDLYAHGVREFTTMDALSMRSALLYVVEQIQSLHEAVRMAVDNLKEKGRD